MVQVLSVDGQVRAVIAEAASENNQCEMYKWWMVHPETRNPKPSPSFPTARTPNRAWLFALGTATLCSLAMMRHVDLVN